MDVNTLSAVHPFIRNLRKDSSFSCCDLLKDYPNRITFMGRIPKVGENMQGPE
ncbi:hypothetical protein JHK86_031831 [Glycine max]|nr:hypothetical protein JHK86_031831 [Glycine max]